MYVFVFACLRSCVCLPSVLAHFVFSLRVLSCVFLCFCFCAGVVVLACHDLFERFNALVYALIFAGCNDFICICSSVVCVVFCCGFVYALCLFCVLVPRLYFRMCFVSLLVVAFECWCFCVCVCVCMLVRQCVCISCDSVGLSFHLSVC